MLTYREFEPGVKRGVVLRGGRGEWRREDRGWSAELWVSSSSESPKMVDAIPVSKSKVGEMYWDHTLATSSLLLAPLV